MSSRISDLNLVSTILAKWFFDGPQVYSEWREDSFLYQIFKKKFNAFGLPTVLPDELLMIIEICTEGNPAYSQLIIRDLIISAKDKNLITPEDFVNVFGDKFPFLDDPEIMLEYEEKWRNQQVKGLFGMINKVDKPGFWLECY